MGVQNEGLLGSLSVAFGGSTQSRLLLSVWRRHAMVHAYSNAYDPIP